MPAHNCFDDMTNRDSIWRTLDFQVIIMYLVLVFWGWATIYSASYDFDSASIFSFSLPSGKQLMWIGVSLLAGTMMLSVDSRSFYDRADLIYIGMMFLLLLTIFIAPVTKGSRSWLTIGGFSVQPAEFAKFATILALAKYLRIKGYTPGRLHSNAVAWLIILLPVMLIFLQNETGTALVFLSLFLVLYREGMPGVLLTFAVGAAVFFVLAVRFGDVMWWEETVAGRFYVLSITQIIFLLVFRLKNPGKVNIWRVTAGIHLGVTGLCVLLNVQGVHFDLVPVQLGLLGASLLLVIFLFFKSGFRGWLLTLLIVVSSVAFLFAVDYIFDNVLQPHQRIRIEVLLGTVDDPLGSGYNVNQAKIAIGSGGLWGKGYLHGTQTKLKYVPEQHTDFIFCTVAEEFGFAGCLLLTFLYVYLIIRLMLMAERQRNPFVRAYGYGVASIFFFHFLVNIGMVLGLMPVIGIPLPFFSYGGSSLLGFTLMLFIFLKLDADRFRYH